MLKSFNEIESFLANRGLVFDGNWITYSKPLKGIKQIWYNFLKPNWLILAVVKLDLYNS